MFFADVAVDRNLARDMNDMLVYSYYQMGKYRELE